MTTVKSVIVIITGGCLIGEYSISLSKALDRCLILIILSLYSRPREMCGS